MTTRRSFLGSILAAKAGKDVYSEKPVTLTIAQGQALCGVMKRYGRIYQSGTQGRSGAAARQACELVRNGKIGQVVRPQRGAGRQRRILDRRVVVVGEPRRRGGRGR